MKKWSLFILICLIAAAAFGQRKKNKDPYAEYWALEAKKERYDSAMQVADRFFEADALEQAKTTYQAAVKIWPEGQEAQAKIRDIQILKARRAAAREKEPVTDVEPIEDTVLEIAPPPVVASDTVKKSKEKLNVKKLEVDTLTTQPLEEREPEVKDTITPPPIEKKTIKTEEPQKKLPTKPVKVKEPDIKPLETRKLPDDTLYQSHEVFKNKEVWEIVSVKNKNPVVYRKVKHHYGAIFYFKDKEAISRNRYIEETEALLKK